ncbi:hypothetical protein GA0070618_6677 [Micromonospora echinospora]|uniref:Uncharacterized protein n=1 Tax=Micromonospora echinospora TaxID=1877 RepID=A0A1C5AC05_MICEC|nr:hypothetical protein [Micromonospora echinospora]SCE66567.1 hypothetical protein GA0070618_0007 [Micromonospora echinospora]SCF42554.1 hypothetical protein GA0070618_6677 [Micromonospora echinospora]
MFARLRARFAEWREAGRVPDGWETPEGQAALARILRETTAERKRPAPEESP